MYNLQLVQQSSETYLRCFAILRKTKSSAIAPLPSYNRCHALTTASTAIGPWHRRIVGHRCGSVAWWHINMASAIVQDGRAWHPLLRRSLAGACASLHKAHSRAAWLLRYVRVRRRPPLNTAGVPKLQMPPHSLALSSKASVSSCCSLQARPGRSICSNFLTTRLFK